MSDQDQSAKKIASEIFKMQPDALVEFFEINFSNLQADFSELENKYGTPVGTSSEPVYRFTSNINGSNPLYWQGKAYQPLPIETEGFESPSDGRLPRPKLKISNPSGLLSSIVAVNFDLHGCKVTRKRTFVKFLDQNNFLENTYQFVDVDGKTKTSIRNRKGEEDSSGNITPVEGSNPFGHSDPNAHLPDDVYYIHRKLIDTRDSIEFEMTSILEIGDVKFPDRQILADYCGFRYRNIDTCMYQGLPVSSPNGQRFSQYGISKFYILVDGSRVPLSVSNVKKIPEWGNSNIYSKGDVVRLTSSSSNRTPSVYVCVKTLPHNVKSPTPSSSEEVWVLDSCTKTLDSCLCRFGSRALQSNKGINFGGFPSTDGARHV